MASDPKLIMVNADYGPLKIMCSNPIDTNVLHGMKVKRRLV
jgi:hypothetical protein